MDDGASGALAAAVVGALGAVPGLSGAFDGRPAQAGDAHAVVEPGPETDWGHKSGDGAEVRFAVLVRCGGEAPARARALGEACRAAIARVGPQVGGWRLVSLAMLRARMVPSARRGGGPDPGAGWTAAIEYRARLLRG